MKQKHTKNSMATKTEPKQERILLKTDKAPSKKTKKKKKEAAEHI